ncbi:MAG: hypothetical protein ACXVCY_03400 [Pseudobdellovibrionaceae bacterium]
MNKCVQCALIGLVFIFSSFSYAQRIKVQKIKGNQAVVEFPEGTLRPGKTYELNSIELAENFGSASSRNYLLALRFNLLNTKSDTTNATNQTQIAFTGKFGWNFGNFEIGPLASYTSEELGNITTSTYKAGAFIDFNVIANTQGEAFLYGIGAATSGGQISSGTTRDMIDFFVGPFVKWFPSGSNVGFRVDAGYIYSKQSGGIGADITSSGIATNVDLLAYFGK